MRLWWSLLLVPALAGCAGLSPAARAIVVSNKGDTAKCRFIQVVYGGPALDPRSEALENAARLRATHIVPLYEKDQKFTADAFDCNTATEPAKTQLAQTGPAPVQAAPAPRARGGHPDWVIAVMNVEDRTGDREALPDGLIQNLGDQLRIFIAEKGLRTIDKGQQERTLKEQITLAKNESYKSCYDNTCQVELGKALAASHILRSQVSKFGKSCVLNVELIDLKAEVTVSAASSRGTCQEEGFLDMTEQVAANLSAR